jgi:hypothetical protein
MRTPYRNVARGLDATLPRGRSAETVEVSRVDKRRVSMIAPGMGDISDAPGTSGLRNGDRSAKHYGDVVGRRFGGG